MTPEKIHAAQLQAISYHQHLTDLRFKIKQLEAEITLEACGQLRPDGKPILSNDLVRQAAITSLRAQREDYMQLRAEIREAEARAWCADADLELQRNLFKVATEPQSLPQGEVSEVRLQPVCLNCGTLPMRAGSMWCSDVCEQQAAVPAESDRYEAPF